MKILVVNSGSSSLKFQLFKVPNLRVLDLRVLAIGLIEQINGKNSSAHLRCFDGDGERKEKIERGEAVNDHSEAVRIMKEMLCESGMMCDFNELAAIGHRVVHGGELFHEPTLITGKVIRGIEELIPLAPLHNPANLTGIREAARHAGDIPQVAVFDTAFHRTIPPHGYLYALPYELYEKEKVRRYGFHGISHGYVSGRAAKYLDRPLAQLNIITLHLGNGVSAAAIKGGRCVDTSMGMTPLEGLIMGTRCGDLDPAILFYLGRETGMSMADLDNLLNKESGLKGICGRSDMRTITEMAEQGDEQAGLALTMFCYRLKKYIGAYSAVLGRVDCIVFTGGIGENSPVVRRLCCEGLEAAGIVLDEQGNLEKLDGINPVHSPESRVALLVIATDEEREIASQTLRVISRVINGG